MKIAITSQGETLESQLDLRFGRCKYFIFVNPESLEYESIENPYFHATGGAGVQAAKLVLKEAPDLIITGDIGPKALSIVSSLNIMYLKDSTEKIIDIIEEHKKKCLN